MGGDKGAEPMFRRRCKHVALVRRCHFVVFVGALVAQLSGATRAQEPSVFDEPTPLDQLLVPQDAPLSAELLTLCVKQNAELEKRKARSHEERRKLEQHQWFIQQMGLELETMKRSVSAANKKAIFDYGRAYASAQKDLAAATDAYNSRIKEGEAASESFNKTCNGRLVSKETQDAVRQKGGVLPNLRQRLVPRPPPTAEQKMEIDAYHNYLTAHIKTERLKTEVGAHRKRNTVAEGSSGMQVNMTISPSGNLLSHSIKVSSGDPALDAIVLAGVERAQPFAPPPEVIASNPMVWRLGFFGSPRK
ncbi:TonB family protein [Hyphomicrobium sp. xq]|uniref:TonB family protein n=1 Tax=Hyphomicrobium album TaxID=2665159 RepID=A0A6I3KFY5_9HYPH|nr:TonB family protein [Hyphomicrobium album]MTD93458.1 TonB family protein [Hyphomicrobium album]